MTSPHTYVVAVSHGHEITICDLLCQLPTSKISGEADRNDGNYIMA